MPIFMDIFMADIIFIIFAILSVVVVSRHKKQCFP